MKTRRVSGVGWAACLVFMVMGTCVLCAGNEGNAFGYSKKEAPKQWFNRVGARTYKRLSHSVSAAASVVAERFSVVEDAAKIIRCAVNPGPRESALKVVPVSDEEDTLTSGAVRQSVLEPECIISRSASENGCTHRRLACSPNMVTPVASCSQSEADRLGYDSALTGDAPCHKVSPGLSLFTFSVSCALVFQADENITQLEEISAAMREPNSFWVYTRTERGLLAIENPLSSLNLVLKAFNFEFPFSDNSLRVSSYNLTRAQVLGEEALSVSLQLSEDVLALDSPFVPGGRLYLEARVVSGDEKVKMSSAEKADVARIFMDVAGYEEPFLQAPLPAWIPAVITLGIIACIGVVLLVWSVAYRRKKERLFGLKITRGAGESETDLKSKIQ